MSLATDYFKNQAKLLQSSYEGSGTSHKGDTGTNREDILAEWLKKHLPRSTTPEFGGQIIDSTGRITKQVDIVLYNDSAPRFGGNPKSYFFAEGTIVAIQVKSKLTSSELSSAIDNLDTVKQCAIRQPSTRFSFTIGEPSENIMTGIFAFELGFASIKNLIKSLKKHEAQGKKPVDFICINQKVYIAYNKDIRGSGKGIWHATDDDGNRSPMPLGYIEADTSQECIFRLVLTLSSEAKKNIATAVDFQPYFIDGWNVS